MSYLDTPLVVGQEVRVYRNLHLGNWSVQARIAGKGWRVVRHSAVVVLEGATFQVNEAGRQRVLREKKKNVHAYILGRFVRFSDGPGNPPFSLTGEGPSLPISYNPYQGPHFYAKSEAPGAVAFPLGFMARVYLLGQGAVWGVQDYPARLDGAGVVFCDDCRRHIPEIEAFWFTDWKAPSEVYCDGCGPRHGFPFPVGDPPEGDDHPDDDADLPASGWVYDAVEGWVESTPLPPIIPAAERPAGAPWPDDCPF